MNPLLAAIYGQTKTASEEPVGGEEIDLSEISAADFIQGVNDGTIQLPQGDEEGPEKTAGDEDEQIDLSQLSGRELLELYAAAEEEEQEKTAAAALEKMAESGELERWDLAGRIMAHAMNDELNKLASANGAEEGGDDVVSLDDINGEQLMEMLNSGEWELVGDE